MIRRAGPLLVLPLALSGCIGTVTTVATAPFKVVGKAVDWTTTSQSERDRNNGRKMRKQQEREDRDRRELAKRCHKHPNDPDCGAAGTLND